METVSLCLDAIPAMWQGNVGNVLTAPKYGFWSLAAAQQRNIAADWTVPMTLHRERRTVHFSFTPLQLKCQIGSICVVVA